MNEQRSIVLDRAHLAHLYQQCAPKILDYVYRQVSSLQDAEDILIDVFVAALESRSFASFFLLTDDSGGTVAVKWYANGHLYSPSSHYEASLPTASSHLSPTPTLSRNSPVPAGTPIEDNFSVTYHQPVQGKVELYWKGKLAVTLLFVVKS